MPQTIRHAHRERQPDRAASAVTPQEEAALAALHRFDGKQRFFCYDHRASLESPLRLSWCGSHDDAAESFLLPRLVATMTWPHRARRVEARVPAALGQVAATPASGTHLEDPESSHPAMLVAITADGGRFLIGMADWVEDAGMDHADLWGSLDLNERSGIEALWEELERMRGVTRPLADAEGRLRASEGTEVPPPVEAE